MALVGPQRIAKLFGCTVQHVGRLVEDGMPRQSRGKYDLEKCAAWYIRHLREAVKRQTLGKDAAGAVKLRERKADIAEVDAEMRRLDLFERKRALISVEASARLWDDAVSRMRNNMLGTIPESAKRLVGVDNLPDAQAIFEECVHEALRAAASAAEDIAPSNNGDAEP